MPIETPSFVESMNRAMREIYSSALNDLFRYDAFSDICSPIVPEKYQVIKFDEECI